MLHTLRKLARAIHRRSVWQVLFLYLLGSWGLFAAVRALSLGAGLPAWTPTLLLLLLVVMLPLVVATAVVQGGIPGLRIEDEVDPNELPGRTPDEVLVVPEAHPLYGARILTWRNMVLGGVTSAALLVTTVVAYMSMWALGIGPVGSLLAQGVVQQGDVVALTAFENRTDDSSLAALVTDAFELELSRSSVATLADAGDLEARLVVSGEVARRGDGYLVSSQIAVPGRSPLARFREASSGEDDLLIAIERLTERVRERLGESLRAIREGERLAPITTESSEALRLYRQAGRARNAGDVPGAIDLLAESVGADPTFAMAWRRLGVLAEEIGDIERARAAYLRVVELWGPGGSAERTVQGLRERIAALE